MAVKVEEAFAAAFSQPSYLRKITTKLMAMESKSQPPLGDSPQHNPDNSDQNLANIDNVDWRSQLLPDCPQRIVNKMQKSYPTFSRCAEAWNPAEGTLTLK